MILGSPCRDLVHGDSHFDVCTRSFLGPLAGQKCRITPCVITRAIPAGLGMLVGKSGVNLKLVFKSLKRCHRLSERVVSSSARRTPVLQIHAIWNIQIRHT